MKKLSLIILSYNNKKDLISCVKSCCKADFPPNWGKEIIVVDNASRDKTIVKIRAHFPEVKMIASPENLGYAGGMNMGIDYALQHGADAILCLNQDTVVPRDLFLHLIDNLFTLDKASIIGPLVKFRQGGKTTFDTGAFKHPVFKFAVHNNVSKVKYNNPQEREFLSGVCLLIKRDTFKLIGKFDEKYFLYYEDDDFCKRAREKGLKIFVIPSAIITHSKSDVGLSPQLSYYFSRNFLYYSLKHNPTPIFLIDLFYWLSRFFVFMIKDIRVSPYYLYGFWDFIKGNYGKCRFN